MPPRQFPVPLEGTVRGVTADGRLRVELAEQPGITYAARWAAPATTAAGDPSHTHPSPGTPPAGTTCLVLFASASARKAWVVAFEGWPT
jgi:hypothetical protein